MILEIAELHARPGCQQEFEEAVRRGLNTVIAKAGGFQRYEFRRSIESPERYVLQIAWDTLEDHTVGFRGSPAYAEWRAIVSDHFAKPPSVEHFEFVAGTRE